MHSTLSRRNAETILETEFTGSNGAGETETRSVMKTETDENTPNQDPDRILTPTLRDSLPTQVSYLAQPGDVDLDRNF